MKMNAKSVTAVIVFVLTWLNVALDAFGIKLIPIDNEGLYTTVSVLMALGSALYNIWHNFNFTEAAKIAQDFLNSIKSGDLKQLAEVFATAQKFIKQYEELKGEISTPADQAQTAEEQTAGQPENAEEQTAGQPENAEEQTAESSSVGASETDSSNNI